ncbi:MAG: SpoIID/LytB domain-containing protein [Flavobacteriales bacterium]
MNLRALLVLLLFPHFLHAQERTMRIGLLRELTVKHALVMSSKGTCTIYADGEARGDVQANDGLRIEVVPGGLSAKSLSLTINARQRIEVVPRSNSSGFRLRSLDHKLAERSYVGGLEVSLVDGALLLVNNVPIEAYTAGVVLAEAGKAEYIEYYKLQSVSCRTYALTNQRKHLPEGYELCDGVHCQVYQGRNTNDSIRQAVEATYGLVMVDANIRLIHATFHSNCGGETMNAEDLWSKSEPYLRATLDTFCLNSPHATWEKTLSRSEWLGYLQRRFSFPATASPQQAAVLNYEPHCRDLYLGNTWPLVPLKQVREDLDLRSTYFSVHSAGDLVVLKGRGFGHGVGLCQEGSMHMAQRGYTYADILHHYYADVHLVDIGTLDFFREEAPVPTLGIAGPAPR